MIELIVALLVIGAALVVFAPVLADRNAPAAGSARPARRHSGHAVLDEERATLGERKHRLLRSLRELEAERAAGRVAEADYVALRDRDQAEAAGSSSNWRRSRRTSRPGAEPRRSRPPRPHHRCRPGKKRLERRRGSAG